MIYGLIVGGGLLIIVDWATPGGQLAAVAVYAASIANHIWLRVTERQRVERIMSEVLEAQVRKLADVHRLGQQP